MKTHQFCPACHQPVQEWTTFRHITRKLMVRARFERDEVVTHSGITIDKDLFLQFYEKVNGG